MTLKRKKKIIILISGIVLIGVIVWRYAVTRDDYVFRDLRSEIAQIVHHEYVDSVSIELHPSHYPGPDRCTVSLVRGVPGDLLDQITGELMAKLDEFVCYDAAASNTKGINPNDLSLWIEYQDDNESLKYITCSRRIIFPATEINSLLKEIVRLNKIIYSQEIAKFSSDDNRNERQLLLDQLAALISVTYSEEPWPSGTDSVKLVVKSNGEVLVDHDRKPYYIGYTGENTFNHIPGEWAYVDVEDKSPIAYEWWTDRMGMQRTPYVHPHT